jgi:predicted metal-binding protein
MAAINNNPQLKPIRRNISEEDLLNDLQEFKVKAIEWGASMAEVVSTDWVRVDERVYLKCLTPLCPYYNHCLNCPPHTPSPGRMQKILSQYKYAVLLALDVVPVSHFAGTAKDRRESATWGRKCLEIVGRVEKQAFESGYYLAMGFAQASCLKTLCKQKRCLVLDGGKCPYPLKARPSMEAVGIDVYGLVTRVGWDIYPVNRSVIPEQVPRALSVGIILIH